MRVTDSNVCVILKPIAVANLKLLHPIGVSLTRVQEAEISNPAIVFFFLS
jgi:hypothetical protein